jgi:hypothetical protein
VDWLRLSFATVNQKMIAVELATTKAQACLAGKAFGMI